MVTAASNIYSCKIQSSPVQPSTVVQIISNNKMLLLYAYWPELLALLSESNSKVPVFSDHLTTGE